MKKQHKNGDDEQFIEFLYQQSLILRVKTILLAQT